MSGLAIIANPNAHRNKNWPLASQALRKAAPGAALYETRTERELRDAAAQVGRDRPRVRLVVLSRQAGAKAVRAHRPARHRRWRGVAARSHLRRRRLERR